MGKNQRLRTYSLLIIPVLLLVVGQLSTKYGALKINAGQGGIIESVNLFIVIGYLCLLARGLMWVFVLRKVDLSFAYPFLSISFVLVLFFSNLIFGEVISTAKIFGTILIIGGVTAIGFSGGGKND